jgi:20S proteasome alpha/beta subunit
MCHLLIIYISFVLILVARVSQSAIYHNFDSIGNLSPSPGKYTRTSLPKEIQYHGTTTLSFICHDGIVIAVDSRASIGDFVGSRTVKKIFPMNQHILATMAGGAADCSYWIRKVACYVNQMEAVMESNFEVGAVAKLLATNLRVYRGSGITYYNL